MKKREWLILAVIILLSVGVSYTRLHQKPVSHTQTTTTAQTQPVEGRQPFVAPTRETLLAWTNKARQDNGLTPLQEDPRLDESAQRKADDEATYKYYNHVSPHDGRHGYTYIFEAYPSCTQATENLSVSETSELVVNGWLNSPPHREALLSPDDIAVGFGISGRYIVQHFCDAR